MALLHKLLLTLLFFGGFASLPCANETSISQNGMNLYLQAIFFSNRSLARVWTVTTRKGKLYTQFRERSASKIFGHYRSAARNKYMQSEIRRLPEKLEKLPTSFYIINIFKYVGYTNTEESRFLEPPISRNSR